LYLYFFLAELFLEPLLFLELVLLSSSGVSNSTCESKSIVVTEGF
jgi:hypothetical protein